MTMGGRSRPNDAPLGTGTGTLEIVADGHGKYTSGQMTEQLADDTHALGTNVCTFDLVRGHLREKSRRHHREHHDLETAIGKRSALRRDGDGRQESCLCGQRPRLPRTSTSYVLADGRTVFVASNPLGVAIGACHPIDD